MTARADRMLRRVAVHEAGHAVAAFYLQQRIRRVSIIPRGTALGHVAHTPLQFGSQGMFDDSLRGINRAERRVIILYAGPLAERKFVPDANWRSGASSDFETAGDLMVHLQGADDKTNTLYSKLLWRRAEWLVDLRWREINAIAAELLRSRTLGPNTVNAAIIRASRDRSKPEESV